MMLAALDAAGSLDTSALAESGWPARVQPVAQAALDLMLGRGKFDENVEQEQPRSTPPA